MQVSGLVSIITPCYNSGACIHRLLDSILMQDYPSIEMFAIDDGSTDNTKEVITSYISKFEGKGYSLTYIYQENAGQAAAVNRGMKLVKGEFLAWPDSDDYYNRTDAISTFVCTLNSLDDNYGVVCFVGTFVEETTLAPINRNKIYNSQEQLFETCLLGGDFLAVPINYMVRMTDFDKVNPLREIYTGQHAQNMQMLLPLFYSYKCKTIQQSLCNILERSSSYSRISLPYEKKKEEISAWLDIKLNTLLRIKELPAADRLQYEKRCVTIDLLSKLELALLYMNKKDADISLRALKKNGEPASFKVRIKAMLLHFPFIYNLSKRFKRCFHH